MTGWWGLAGAVDESRLGEESLEDEGSEDMECGDIGLPKGDTPNISGKKWSLFRSIFSFIYMLIHYVIILTALLFKKSLPLFKTFQNISLYLVGKITNLQVFVFYIMFMVKIFLVKISVCSYSYYNI